MTPNNNADATNTPVSPSDNIATSGAKYGNQKVEYNKTPGNQVRLPNLIIDDLLGRSRTRPRPEEQNKKGI